MKYGTFILISIVFSSSMASEIKSGDYTGGSSPVSDAQSQVYNQEMKCVLEKLAPNADEKQKNRAYHFARTIADLTSGWSPVLAANWRRHLYAQVLPETAFFKLNVEQEPIQSKLADVKYKGRGWIQLTHKENYTNYACFRQNIEKSGPTSNIEELQKLAITKSKGCEYKNIVSDPDAAFKYTDVSSYDETTEANKNNDLSAVYYFLMKSEEQSAFENALKEKGTSAVQKVRRGVNIGNTLSSKKANGEDKALEAYDKIGSCFSN